MRKKISVCSGGGINKSCGKGEELVSDSMSGGTEATPWSGPRVSGTSWIHNWVGKGSHPVRIPGKGAHSTLSLPTGSPRMWWAVGRAKRNLLVLWLTVWRMDDTHISPGRSGAAKSLGASQPQWMVPPLPGLPPSQLTVLSRSRSRYFSLGSRRVAFGRRDLRIK